MLMYLLAALFAVIFIVAAMAVSPLLWAIVNMVAAISGLPPVALALVSLIPIVLLALAGWGAVQMIFGAHK